MCLQDRVDFLHVDFVDPGVDPGAFATAFSVARFDDAVNKKNPKCFSCQKYITTLLLPFRYCFQVGIFSHHRELTWTRLIVPGYNADEFVLRRKLVDGRNPYVFKVPIVPVP